MARAWNSPPSGLAEALENRHVSLFPGRIVSVAMAVPSATAIGFAIVVSVRPRVRVVFHARGYAYDTGGG
jgi:hypothetical protein